MSTDAADSLAGILTPDQRPRVFISSTLAELAPERAAARRAVESLRLIPVMFELGARPHPARSLYRAYLAQSHIFIGLYAERYGWVAPGQSVSGLEDEYLLSGGLPRLVYLKSPAPGREERLDALLDRIRADDQVSYRSFADPDDLERLMREDLAVLLGERFLLPDAFAAGSGGGLPDPEPAQAVRRSLPRPLTEVIGRESEIEHVIELLVGGARLVTLVGPGGIGKTRVALEVAHRVATTGEVVFVPLDTVSDPDEVLPAIGTALDIGLDDTERAPEALARALRDRSLLLVLDNLEQVREGASQIGDLLQRCPGVTVLATSRAGLRVRGERQVPIGPLAMPNGDRSDVQRYAAVRLFLDRAREVRPDLSLDAPEDADAVAELTRRLEGIPLALELAAARSRTLPPSALLSRVGTALDLGSGAVDVPERQRTLRDTVAWSEELLAPDERRVLHDLAIFEGPWTLTDAEAVADEGVADVLDSVAGLVEHSLVHPSASARSEPRFRLYEAVRAYARSAPDDPARAETQARFIARMAEDMRTLDAGFRSADHARWRSEFRLMWPDLRNAIELSLARKEADHLGALTRSWVGLWMDGRPREVVDLMDRCLELAEREQPDDLGDVILSAAGLSFNLGDYPRAEALIDRLRDEVALPDEPELPGTLELYRGYLSAGRGDLAASEQHLKEAVRLLADCGDGGAWIAAFARNGLGSLYALRGEREPAFAELAASGELGRRFGNVAAELQTAVFTAAMRIQAGEVELAAELLRTAADFVDRYPYYESNAYCVEVAGAVALTRGDPDSAAVALGAGQALRDVVGARVWPLLTAVRAGIEDSVRGAMDAPAFSDAIARGRDVDLLTLAEMVRRLVAAQPVAAAADG